MYPSAFVYICRDGAGSADATGGNEACMPLSLIPVKVLCLVLAIFGVYVYIFFTDRRS